MGKERLAFYTVTIPVTFTFKARASIDSDILFKMAESYADLKLGQADVDFNKKDLAVINKTVIFTEEEIAEENRKWNEWIKACKEERRR